MFVGAVVASVVVVIVLVVVMLLENQERYLQTGHAGLRTQGLEHQETHLASHRQLVSSELPQL